MNITVRVEPSAGRFRAVTSQPVPLESEGASREEALQRLQSLAAARMAQGDLVQLSIPDTNPWLSAAGIWSDHPEYPDVLKHIADQRQAAAEASSP